jgi:SAM-dependent methyltransferase
VRLWNRLFALAYDSLVERAERRGIGEERRALLAEAHGRVLEIGAGTGLNLAHYPPGVDLVLTEPEPFMARRLSRRGVDVVGASADALPFDDDSFDTVVSTFVLCTVPDVAAALREVRRVLADDGRLLFLEHVRAPEGSRLARRQDRLHRPWRALACGCNCNRDLLVEIGRVFPHVDASSREWPFVPQLVRPVVTGLASS